MFVYAKPPRKTLDRCFFLSWGGTELVSPAGSVQRHARTFQGSSYRTAFANLRRAHSARHKELSGSVIFSEQKAYLCLSATLIKKNSFYLLSCNVLAEAWEIRVQVLRST